MTEALRVVVYAAKSTTDEKGSIPQQIEECVKHAAAQGWTVDGKPETDEAASAWSGSRGDGLKRAMKRAETLAKTHGRAGLLVWKSNRLARGELVSKTDARHLIDYFRWADRANIELLSVTDAGTFMNSMVAMIVGEMNALESRAKSDAVKRAFRAKRQEGKHVYGFVYGYERDKDRGLRPNPETAPVVQRIFSMVAGGATQSEVARALTAEGVPSARGGRSGWSQGSLSAMLRRRTYIGEVPTDDPADREHKDVPEAWGPGLHEAIVSRDTFDAVQAANARRANRKGKGGGRPSKAGHLLPGSLLHHAVCGRAMVPRSYDARKTDGKVKGVYTCSGAKGGACDGLTVPMEAVDGAILGYLASVGVDTEATLRLLNDSTKARREAAATELDGARRDLARLEEEHARMWADRRAGNLDAEDWQTFKAEHAEETAATKAKLKQLEARAAEAPAPVIVPAVADALALVRDFIARGDHNAVRNIVEALFSDFLIGEVDDLAADDAPLVVTAEAAREARAALRDQIGRMEARAGRTVAEANAEAEAEAAAIDLPYPPPAHDPLTEGLQLEGMVLLPEPRAEALAVGPDSPAILVDEHGRSLFRRLPLQTTNADGLQT